MKYKMALLGISLVLLVLLAACSSKEGTTPSPPLLTSPTPTADIESVVRSRVEATVEAIRSRLPEATPIPRLDRGTVLQFARGYKLTNEEWERFHDDFDKWRQGLLPCNASALQDRLREFAGRISLLTEEARALPKGGVVKEISDDIVEAMGTEAISLRQLRDNWSPQSTSLFELVESERATAASVRRNAEKRLANLEEATSDSSRDRAEAFSNAMGQLNTQWEQFRQDYEKFRQDEPAFIPADAFRQLSQLVAQFADIVKASRDLPSFQNTLPMAQILAKAAEDEDLALRKLRDLFQRATSVEPGSSGNSSF